VMGHTVHLTDVLRWMLDVVLAAYRSGEDHEPKKVERTP
jgi:hypothetical protein